MFKTVKNILLQIGLRFLTENTTHPYLSFFPGYYFLLSGVTSVNRFPRVLNILSNGAELKNCQYLKFIN